ncbi:uncharacterized protein [Typha latifolia]|uniref:uncharacterized protein n=1 Tax=Typha latifolia TaxID=4733 RepID=UPI003C2B6CEE
MGKREKGGKDGGKDNAPTPKKRSKLGLMGLILRRRKPKKVAPAEADKAVARPGSKSIWRAFVTAIRPLHHHHHHQLAPATSKPTALVKDESFYEVAPGPPSPGHSSADSMSSHASSTDSMSRYMSAEDLSLGSITDSEEEGRGGDEEINSKADEFIAKFYEQIRLEKLACDDEEMID